MVRHFSPRSLLLSTLAAAIVSFVSLPLHAEIKSDIVYGNADGTPLKLDVGMPDGPGPFPVVLMIHGGGWASGDKAADFVKLYKPLAEQGIVWFSINYRLAPAHRWPACFDDVKTAIKWVKAHASEYKGDPHRMALLGYSAGGHLAFLAATTDSPDMQVQALVGMAPPTDLELDLPTRGGLSPSLQALLDRPHKLTPEARQILHDISAVNHLHPGLPPILIVHGDKDHSVPYQGSLNLQKKVEALGDTCKVITMHGAPHNIKTWPKYDPEYAQQIADWLHKELYALPAAAHP